jgi:hypothetical protein
VQAAGTIMEFILQGMNVCVVQHTFAAVFLFSFATALCAQSPNASLGGCVTDPAKGRIVEAKVASISGTNFDRKMSSRNVIKI